MMICDNAGPLTPQTPEDKDKDTLRSSISLAGSRQGASICGRSNLFMQKIQLHVSTFSGDFAFKDDEFCITNDGFVFQV